jgi:hypothetical protein
MLLERSLYEQVFDTVVNKNVSNYHFRMISIDIALRYCQIT